ncbi:MAG: oligosaccharide flippase family protein [Planctomyces sp.]|nr:oligosaccharide flippase family protein [Planctomyces sp.]
MSLTRSVSAKWLAHIVTMAVGFFLMPYVMRTIGESGYGAWVFVNSIAGYSSLLYMGFGATVCRFVADARARQDWIRLNAVCSGVFAVYLVAAAAVMLVACGLAWAAPALGDWGDVPISDVRIAMILLGLNIAVGMLGSVHGGVLIAAQRFDLYSGIEAATALTRLGLTVALLQKQQALVTLALIFLCVTLFENGVTVWLARRESPTLAIRRRFVSRAVLRECFSFSAYTALRGMAVQLIYLSDVVVIGIMLGKDAAVPYYVALRLVQMVHGPLEKIGDVVLPKAGALHAAGDRTGLQALCSRAMGLSLLLAAAFLIGGAYFGDLFITTWMGPGLSDSWMVLVILSAAQVVGMPLIMLRQTLMAVGAVRRPALIDIGQALINLALSIALAPVWGLVGVAVGTLVPLLIADLFILLPYGLRALRFDGRRLVEDVLRPQLVPLGVLVLYCEGVGNLHPQPGWLSVGAIGAGAAGVLAAVLFGQWRRPRAMAAAG